MTIPQFNIEMLKLKSLTRSRGCDYSLFTKLSRATVTFG